MSVQETFAQNMRIYRIREGLSQEALAEKCGLHRTYIGLIEQKSCNVTLDTMQKIAIALKVNPIELLKESHPYDNESSDISLADLENADKGTRHHYALCSWNDGGKPEFTPIEVQNKDLTLRILCALVQEGYADDLAAAYDRVQEPIIRYLQELKKSEFPKDFFSEIWTDRPGESPSK